MTNNSVVVPNVLTAIVCVVRASVPAVLAQDHVVQLLDDFMGAPVLSSLPNAAASGSMRWFERVYQRTLGDDRSLATPPRLDEDGLAEYALSNAIKAAVTHGHLAIVQRIHELHPQRLSVRLLPIAAEAGDLVMFQWLLAHRSDDLCTPDYESDERPPIELLSCCLHRAYSEAIRYEQLPIVKWLLGNGYRPVTDTDEKAGDTAASRGDLEMVQWLHTHNIRHSFSKQAIDDASKHGHLQVVQYLVTNRSDGFTGEAVHHAVIGGYDAILEVLRVSDVLSVEELEGLGEWAYGAAMRGRLDLLASNRYTMEDPAKAMRSAVQYGHLHVVQWLWQTYQAQPNAWWPALNGHLHILQWMHGHEVFGSTDWTATAMDSAAQNGHLEVVQWLHVHRHEGCTTDAMDDAAMNGHLETVKWLHGNRHEGGTSNAMGLAAKNGHLEIVQWLHGNRNDGCTVNAMTVAAKYGHLEIVQWLHENRSEGCTVNAMDFAAESNHQRVVEWLHAHRTEGCTSLAMTAAARSGHLEMVRWLHEHRHEGYAPAELRYAPLSILKWLHFHRDEGFTAAVMDRAALHGEMGTLVFLHQYRTEGCTSSAATSAASQGHLYIVQWLHEKYPHEFHSARVASQARDSGHFHIVQWLEYHQLVPRNEYR